MNDNGKCRWSSEDCFWGGRDRAASHIASRVCELCVCACDDPFGHVWLWALSAGVRYLSINRFPGMEDQEEDCGVGVWSSLLEDWRCGFENLSSTEGHARSSVRTLDLIK